MKRSFYLLLAVTGLMIAGCERPKSDMGQQAKHNAYDPAPIFADGTSARPLVTGVVPRDDATVPGLPYVRHRPTGMNGVEDAAPLDRPMPTQISAELIARGHEQFDIFCSACHGRLGNGQGMIVQRGFTPPPSFHVQRLKDAPDAHFYNVITYGYGAMYSYDERVLPEDRWAIVAYIRALQLAPDTSHAKLTEPDRAALIAAGDRSTPAVAGGAR